MKATLKLVSIFLIIGLLLSCKVGEKLSKEETINQIKNKVDSNNYTFTARSAIPMTGGSINLTSIYTLKVTKDTISAYLPYYGRAYTAPMDPTEGGIKFVSTNFDYKITPNKKGTSNVSIITNDTKNKERLNLTIGEEGYATLIINDNSRQTISFYGIIE